MKLDTVIQGGTLVGAAETARADIGVAGGRIAAIGLDLPTEGAHVISARDRLVFPGGIDVHTHL
ncbi:MAG TPA: dihydropyrimidinase, partial [Candidatus Methylomirabilis sp.]|nr:dihydropyrimidinase [Candidatus Methylomirabilis sp.]